MEENIFVTIKNQESKEHGESNEIVKLEQIESGILSDGEIISSTVEIISSDGCSFDDFSDFKDLSSDNNDQRYSSSVKLIKSDLRYRDHKYYDSFLRSPIHNSKIHDRGRKHKHKRKRYRSSSGSDKYHKLIRHEKWSSEKDYLDCRKERFYGRSEYSCSRKKRARRRTRSRSPYYREYKRDRNNRVKDYSNQKPTRETSPTNNSHQGNVFNLNSSKEVPRKIKTPLLPISRRKERYNNTEIDDLRIRKRRTCFDGNWNSECGKNETCQAKQIHSDDKTDINGKEPENCKTSKNSTVNNEPEVIESVNNINSVQPPVAPNYACNIPLPQLPSNSCVQFDSSNAYSNIPSLGQDNVPLEIGTNGLPVYFTPQGYQIPYDIDGKRVPIGPNGHYLPLDPFGRVFAHVISPDNVAVPIHMTQDGVLRLPNSEPVPFGPPHQLPVNIDGQIILMGPDSRPFYPCPDVPKYPSSLGCRGISTSARKKKKKRKKKMSPKPQPPTIDVSLLEAIVDRFPVIQKNELLKHYTAEALQKKNTFLKYRGIEEDVRGGTAKTSTPVKRTTGEKLEESTCGNSSDMVLVSSDSGSPSVQNFAQKSAFEDCGDVFSSDCEGNLKIVCDVSACDVMAPSDDPVIRRIQSVLKSMEEGNFNPPSLGRFFVISELREDLLPEPISNASPLLRNRAQLPSISCCLKDFEDKLEKSVQENEISFKFYSRRKIGKVTKTKADEKRIYKVDFTEQCDFTSEVINGLNRKVRELSNELVKVRKVNANLMRTQRQQPNSFREATRLLNKALNEIKEKTVEIESLKRALEKKHKGAN